MNTLRRWEDRVRAQIVAKLGRCSRCMRASLLGALAAVGLLLAVGVAGLPPLLVGGAGVLAAGFAGLVLAHAVAYVYHATHPTAVALGRPCCGQPPAAQRPRMPFQLQRRPLVQVILSLPAAFGFTQLAGVPRAAALPAGATRVTKRFQTSLGCPPCPDGGCVFGATFEYDFVPASGTKIQVTRFKMTWDQANTGGCSASIERGNGAFDFQCVNDTQPCKLTGGNIWQCPCDTRIEFVPLGTSTADDCRCPNGKNRTAYAQGVCGAPLSVEKQCEQGFQWIDLNFRHKVTCTCATGGITRGDLVVVAQYRDGAITFGGNVVPPA